MLVNGKGFVNDQGFVDGVQGRRLVAGWLVAIGFTPAVKCF
jgi:hypothetical protein